MMIKRRRMTLAAMALATVGIGGAGLAYAGASEPGEQAEAQERDDDQKEAQVLAGARISLAQAVQAAEARTGMKASEAGIDDENSQPYFEISVGQGPQEQTVLIDTQTGQVAKIAADTEEGEDEAG